jgi:hypothetical protein
MKWFVLIALVYQAHAADVCDPRKFAGAYGVQLSGDTTISDKVEPVALIGRLVFDGGGSVSGYVSVNYTGLLLGNPVNGSYEMETDCSLSWNLEGDTGAFQHFSGSITGDFLRVQFHQTDEGGAQHGILVRTPKECSAATLQKRYTYSISGRTTAMLPGETEHAVSSSGAIVVGETGKLAVTEGVLAPKEGTIQVDSDCIAHFALVLPSAGAINLRGILLDDGKEILAIQTDPGATVTARFTAQ